MSETDVIRREPPPLADYATARSSFSWDAVLADLGASLQSMNLGALAIERHVAAGRAGDHALIYFPQSGPAERYTFGDLADASGRAAGALVARGVVPGERVLFLLPMGPELVAGILGALRAGAIVGVLGMGRNIDYVRNVLSRTRPRAVVTTVSFRSSLAALRRETEFGTVLFVNRSRLAMPTLADSEYAWADQLEAQPGAFTSVAAAPGDRAFLHYTDLGMSGSVVSHQAALPLFYTARSVLEMRPGESVVSIAIPGDHYFLTYGVLAPLLAGATSVVLEDPARFQRWGDIASELQPRAWFSGFKAIDVMLRVDPNLGTLLAGCRSIACTFPYDRHFVSMTALSYGSPIQAVWTDREFAAIQCAEMRGCDIRPGSVGRAVPGAAVRVVGEDGQPVDGHGRIAVEIGPSAPFVEYWGEEETRVQNGWFITNHGGRMDPDGYVWLDT